MATYKEFSDAAKKQWMDQSQIDAARWKIVNRSSNTTNTSTNNTNSGGSDIYWDVGKKGTAGQNKSEWIATSGWLSYKPTTQQDLWDLAQFGADAYTMEWNKSGSLAKRNDIIANNLYLSGEGVEDYLNQYDSFKNASDADKKNTIRAINERLWIIKANNWDNNDGLDKKWDEGDNLWDNWILGDRGYTDTTPGYFRDAEGNEIKIYGYQALSDDMKKYVDQMSDAEKKKISNMWAQALQDYIKQYADSNYEKDYREKMYGLAKDMRGIQTQQEAIQYGQQLRQAQEQVDNLMQNWEYLWNMGMPWLSKTKLQAISDSIKEANTSLDEMVKLQDLAKQASAKNWEIDVAQYEKQISDIVRDLNYKIPQEIQNALNKYTVAELEGNLDTIDWVVAFKKSLLDDLDNNISGLTSASLQQMQYITDNYMQMADKAYEEAKEYQQNANTVNTEMSGIKGYYVDGNGNPILDSDGQPIKVPQWAPMDPVFDKESGKLIQFGYDENGNIVASVTQVYDGDQSSIQATIVSLLENWVSTQDILKYVPGADLKTVQELAKVVNVQYRSDWLPKTYNWKSYTATTQKKVDEVLATLNKGWWWGQCGYFVNNYLEDLWVWRLYTDPITDKTKNINSTEAKVWNVVVMDSPTHPEYGHVWIITAIDDNWNMTILQSNKNGNEQIFTSTKNINDWGIYGFFDPRKSIDDYNKESNTSDWWVLYDFENGFDPVKVGYYQKYLDWKMVSTDWAQMGDNFMDELHNYQDYINSQVPEEAQKLLDIISDLKKMSRSEYNAAAAWKLLPRTNGYSYYKKYKQFIASASLNNLIDMKSRWATFGALSDNELWFITNAATDLDFGLKYGKFMDELDYYESQLKNKLAKYETWWDESTWGDLWWGNIGWRGAFSS